jgi:predicted permease
VLVVAVDTPSLGYKDNDARLTTLYRQVEERVGETPGVRSSSFAFLTFQPGAWTERPFVRGRTPPASPQEIHNNVVGPGYFATMGLPITLGRGFSFDDNATSPKVAIINETMAHAYFPGESPIGRRFGFSAEHSGDYEVVGVVKDAKYENLREKPTPMAFYPYPQRAQFLGDFTVRYTSDARGIVPQIRRAFAEVNGNLPITEVRTLAEQVDNTLAGDKLIARLSSFFGLLALLLASIGIYGVLSYAVARRTNEVGLRMALGARSSNVLWLVMREVLVLVAIGLGIGVPVALSLERLTSGLFYGLSDVDPLPIAAAVGILAVVAGAAAYLPARRASLVDPSTALRCE